MERQHNIFIGFGTGRCGTKSLARVIGACRNTQVTHECSDWRVPWYSVDYTKVDAMIEHFRQYGKLVGDVGFYWLPHLEYIKSQLPGIKLIWMQRDKNETVGSFIYGQNKVGGDQAVYGPLCPMPNKQKASRVWNRFYPLVDAYDLEQSVEFYWEMYNKWAQNLDCYQMNVYDLNSHRKVDGLFDYLEVPESDRVFLEDAHFNKRK